MIKDPQANEKTSMKIFRLLITKVGGELREFLKRLCLLLIETTAIDGLCGQVFLKLSSNK
jgi:hypothetical protein